LKGANRKLTAVWKYVYFVPRKKMKKNSYYTQLNFVYRGNEASNILYIAAHYVYTSTVRL